MGDERRTESEALFEELCRQHNVACTRLPRRLDSKQPDYELVLAGHRIVAEVKQIEPNDDDRRFTKELLRNGMARQCRVPDQMARRVRDAIKRSRQQINAYLERRPATPAVLVLFDAARNGYTDPYAIQVAMYGWECVVFDGTRIETPLTVIDRGFGHRNNRDVREDKNQQLSALATLHEGWGIDTHERVLSLWFYHNQFAAHPILPEWWSGNDIMHFAFGEKVPGQFQDWCSATKDRDPNRGHGDAS